VLHTGKDLAQLTTEEVLEYRAKDHGDRGAKGVHEAWELLASVGLVPDKPVREVLRQGQMSAAEIVDHYQVQSRPVRDLLIRYLNERRPSLDYGSFRTLGTELVGTFWADIERHHPGIDTIDLPSDVAEAWKQRLRVVTLVDGTTRPRKRAGGVLTRVRAFYLDIAEWALTDPSWAPWAVPSPVTKNDTAGNRKVRKQVTAEVHQRIRERLPHLPVLVDATERHLAATTALLRAATGTTDGQIFSHDGATYRRVVRPGDARRGQHVAPYLLVENLATGEQTDVLRAEDDAFWAWAIIETLRHTGVRHEELLEITHLALVSYRLPTTGETVPLLQIVPSKNNEERLLPID
jgi:hypothetical protein